MNLQKLTLWAWVATASMRMFAPAQKTRSLADAARRRPTSGCSKRMPLHDVGEFDIDAEIVGIELQLVAFEQAALFVDIHIERCDVAVVGDAPMAVVRGSV